MANITNYRKAWVEFRKTKEYLLCYEAMKAKGISQRYVNNILEASFTAGWGDRVISGSVVNGTFDMFHEAKEFLEAHIPESLDLHLETRILDAMVDFKKSK